MIATKLHRLAEFGIDDPLITRMEAAPKYVIAPDLLEIMTREDVQRSILAMIEAGIAHLPYASVLIEFSVAPTVRRFVLLDEAGESAFKARVVQLVRDRLASLSPSEVAVDLDANGLSVRRHNDEAEAHAVVLACSIALLMLNIRGVEKDVIEPTVLNKARQRRGEGRIPTHTHVRIGTIYDRSGNAVGAGTGRKMPVHLRAGHTRMQACGPEYSERKPVFIAPVLVNYREGDGQPRIPARIVRR